MMEPSANVIFEALTRLAVGASGIETVVASKCKL
jgi:hypothetical protein